MCLACPIGQMLCLQMRTETYLKTAICPTKEGLYLMCAQLIAWTNALNGENEIKYVIAFFG